MYRLDQSLRISDATIRRWLSLAMTLGATQHSTQFDFTNASETLAVLRSDADFVCIFGPSLNAQFVSLLASQQIVAHCDRLTPGLNRWHVPIATNSGCWSFSAGIWQQLEVGRRYAIDPTEEHGAVNWGNEARIHLLVDN